MNQDQITGIIRAFAPPLVAYLAAKGWIGAESTGDITALLVAIGVALWSVAIHRRERTVAIVAAMPEVKKVEIEPTPSGKALADAVGSKPSAIVTLAKPPPTSPKDK